MSWRTVVISKTAKLDYQLGYMVVRQDSTVKIFINEIYMLIVESTAVSLTAALLSELSKRKIKVIFCDEKRNPSSELVSYYGAHDTSLKIRNQVVWTEDMKAAVWTEIVGEKIKKQAELLFGLGHIDEGNMLLGYVNEMEYGDKTNREGHAAKVYFNALFGMDFTRTSENSINAALNYGYGLLLSAFNREIVSNGYITQLGLFHDNIFNQFNLGSDLMEPYRPIVDKLVVELLPDEFEHEEKMEMLKLFQLDVRISDRIENVSNAIRIYCKSIFDAINDKDISLIKFYTYEL